MTLQKLAVTYARHYIELLVTILGTTAKLASHLPTTQTLTEDH